MWWQSSDSWRCQYTCCEILWSSPDGICILYWHCRPHSTYFWAHSTLTSHLRFSTLQEFKNLTLFRECPTIYNHFFFFLLPRICLVSCIHEENWAGTSQKAFFFCFQSKPGINRYSLTDGLCLLLQAVLHLTATLRGKRKKTFWCSVSTHVQKQAIQRNECASVVQPSWRSINRPGRKTLLATDRLDLLPGVSASL